MHPRRKLQGKDGLGDRAGTSALPSLPSLAYLQIRLGRVLCGGPGRKGACSGGPRASAPIPRARGLQPSCCCCILRDCISINRCIQLRSKRMELWEKMHPAGRKGTLIE